MSVTEYEPETLPRPTSAQLLDDFGEADLSVQSLFRFCFVPVGRLGLLKSLALDEDWGTSDAVLLKYLAIHIRLSIEQGLYVWNDEQLMLTVGNLRSPSGVPIYAGLVRNHSSDENPWAMNWVGERPSCTELPEPPQLGGWDPIDAGAEIVLGIELAESERLQRVPVLADVPVELAANAILGACHFAVHRDLAVPHWHAAVRSYFLPLFLSSQADLCAAPDLVASVVVQSGRLLIRSILDPEIAYPPARAVCDRADELRSWVQEAWNLSDAGDEDS